MIFLADTLNKSSSQLYYYDQIFVDREDNLFGFSRESIFDEEYDCDYTDARSKKREETLRTIADRVHQYSYRV